MFQTVLVEVACLVTKVIELPIWKRFNDRIDRFLSLEMPRDPNDIDAIQLEDRYLYSANPLFGLLEGTDDVGYANDPVLSVEESQAFIDRYVELSLQYAAGSIATDHVTESHADNVAEKDECDVTLYCVDDNDQTYVERIDRAFDRVDSLIEQLELARITDVVHQGASAADTYLDTRTDMNSRRTAVFIDAGLENFDVLLVGLGDRDATDVFLLRGDLDGIETISNALQQSQWLYSEIHIISHGSAASIQLGATVFDTHSALDYQSQLRSWADYLTEDADLLIYGCDVAATDDGVQLLETISLWTGMDVAASDNKTGHASLGGDWELEYSIGEIEAAGVISLHTQTQWTHLLNLDPVGSEILVNGNTSAWQSLYPEAGGNIAMNAAGNHVVVWIDESSGSEDVFAKVYNADGSVHINAFRVHNLSIAAQSSPSVAMADNGNFVVTWSDDRSGIHEVFMRLFNVNGIGITPEVQVSSLAGSQNYHAVDFASDGSFVVVFHSENDTNIYFQRYSSSGVATGENTVVNNATLGVQTNPDVAVNDDGSFIVTWTSDEGNGNTWDIFARRFMNNGTANGLQFQVSQVASGIHTAPTIDSDSSSNFVVAWQSNQQDGSGLGIAARLYGSDGIAVDDAFTVNTYTTGDQESPHVDMNATGEFIITWQESNGNDGSWNGIYAQQFTSSGATVGNEVLVNTTTAGDQSVPSVAFSGTDVAISWVGNGLGDSQGIFLRRFSSAATPSLDTFEVTTTSDVVDGATTSIVDLVNNPGADGQISLREAILAANNTLGHDTITFNIAGSGTQVISLLSVLPMITEQVTIDGTTQSGWVAGSFLPIVIDGGDLSGDGLVIADSADGSIVRGLVIRDFSGDGIQINSGSTGNIIAGNWIGNFNSDGTKAAATEQNTGNGVNVLGSNNLIGGTILAERNVISGSGSNGVRIAGTGVTGNVVAGNYIGTDIAGTTAVANAGDGVRIESNATGNTVGGSSAVHRNIIAGNTLDGVRISGEGADGNIVRSNWIGLASDGVTVLGNINEGVEIAGGADNSIIGGIGMGNVIVGSGQQGVFISGATTGTVVQGNYIGTNASQTVSGGNAKNGIRIGQSSTASSNTFGGINPDEGNVIANNGTGGVDTAGIHLAGGGNSNSVLGNSIYNNVGLGIDLGNSGVTGNDNLDLDGGSNGQQNFPVIISAVAVGPWAVVTGTLNSNANTNYRIELFSVPAGTQDATHGEGRTFLGAVSVTTDALGNATFTATLSGVSLAAGDRVSGTATVDLGGGSYGSTSEFSAHHAAVINAAPTLDNSGSMTLSTITEDEVTNSGNSVASIIASAGGDRITDADAGASEGIAVEGLTSGNGTWQYSLDGGTSWSDIGAVSSTSALLLRSTDYVRFVPNGETSTVANFSFRAWDQMIGTAGTLVDVSDNGGTTAFSSSTEVALITVTAVNDAPTMSQVTGAVAAYNFENGSGNAPSTVNGGPSMTVGGTVTYNGSAGRIAGSGGLLFTEVGTSATAPVTLSSIPNVTTSGAITVSSWVRFDDVDNWGRVFDFSVGGHANAFLLSRAMTSNDLIVRYHNATGALAGQVLATNALDGALGSWVHVAASLNTSGSMGLYVNGVLRGTTNVGAMANLPTWTINRIGSSNWSHNALFRGAIDDFAIFDRVLTAGEVATLASPTTQPTIVNKSIAENSLNGTLVFNANANDVDAGDTITYSITAQDFAGVFTIDSVTGQVTVANSSLLDYETATSHRITIRATDAGGLFDEEVITIHLTDVNEAPTAVADTAIAVEAGGVNNSTTGTNPTGNVLTNDTDVDTGDTRAVVGVAAGSLANASGYVAAPVTGSYGSITIAANGTYTYTVDNNNPTVQALNVGQSRQDVFSYTMQDAGGLTSTTQITVTIQGANDAPIITSNATASINEANTAIMTIVGNDVDSGTTLVYSIVGGVDAAQFSINSSTGAISFVTAPDFENPTDHDFNNVYDVIIQVSDGSLATTQALAVTVIDVINTLTVTTTADNNDSGITAGNVSHSIEWLNSNRGADGAISLREAIIAANNTPGLDTIDFDIAGSGVQTILINNMSLGALPRITDAVNIDGYSQTGAQANTLAVGSDAVLQIELRGGLTTAQANSAQSVQNYFGGLMFDDGSSGSSVRGLIIGGFLGNEGGNRSGSGIIVRDSNTSTGVGVSNITIAGNWIGLDGTGAANGNQLRGVYVRDASNVTIGGPSAADRNVISGQSTIDARDTGFDGTGTKMFNGSGIQLTMGAINATIQNNYVGTNIQGTAALGNYNGIAAHSWSTAGALVAGNVVSGNVIGIFGRATIAGNLRIEQNTIGLAADGAVVIGNNFGVWIDPTSRVTIGGTTDGTGNVIAANNIGVVVVNSSAGTSPLVAIQRNSIYGNTVLGIDIAANTGGASIQTSPDGETANDGAISDTTPGASAAPNLGMDKPVLALADLVGNSLTLNGYVGSEANQSEFADARVEFFISSTSTGAGQGQVYLGFLTTDANGNFTGTLDVTGFGLTLSDHLTATATLSAATSEFSDAQRLSVPVPSVIMNPDLSASLNQVLVAAFQSITLTLESVTAFSNTTVESESKVQIDTAVQSSSQRREVKDQFSVTHALLEYLERDIPQVISADQSFPMSKLPEGFGAFPHDIEKASGGAVNESKSQMAGQIWYRPEISWDWAHGRVLSEHDLESVPLDLFGFHDVIADHSQQFHEEEYEVLQPNERAVLETALGAGIVLVLLGTAHLLFPIASLNKQWRILDPLEVLRNSEGVKERESSPSKAEQMFD